MPMCVNYPPVWKHLPEENKKEKRCTFREFNSLTAVNFFWSKLQPLRTGAQKGRDCGLGLTRIFQSWVNCITDRRKKRSENSHLRRLRYMYGTVSFFCMSATGEWGIHLTLTRSYQITPYCGIVSIVRIYHHRPKLRGSRDQFEVLCQNLYLIELPFPAIGGQQCWSSMYTPFMKSLSSSI